MADGLLGKSENRKEFHGAIHKLKLEFLLNWDGVRTKDIERVLVLAATNRPYDLDDAVIRRFPRRLILSNEDLVSDVDLEAIAKSTDGYLGSDLKTLCAIAAHRPIKEILEKEKRMTLGTTPELGSSYDIRSLKMDDFIYAHKKLSSSVTLDSPNMKELLQWNDLHGKVDPEGVF
ncbi:hypothetical protein RIF29_25016 [Crotalaria pallida]|uniref:Uncharacterized protein n=1 Tax=Crotalaria pallida TaxID=3830 RepID=A0AAN9EKT3_CROPI